MGEWPLRSHSMAQERPAKPAPTMMTVMSEGGRRGNGGMVMATVMMGSGEKPLKYSESCAYGHVGRAGCGVE
jgi:hypothetical protein